MTPEKRDNSDKASVKIFFIIMLLRIIWKTITVQFKFCATTVSVTKQLVRNPDMM